MPTQGLDVLTEQTSAFIEERPSDIVITRQVRQPDGAGGYRWGTLDLPSQRVRVVQARQGTGVERRTASGETVAPTLTLVCMPTADIQRNTDTLEWEGLRLEVVWVTELDYVKHAELAVRS